LLGAKELLKQRAFSVDEKFASNFSFKIKLDFTSQAILTS